MKDWRVIFSVFFIGCFFVFTQAFAAETYRVKKGDTISGIAQKYGVSAASLKQANKLKGDKLSLNQVLTIPGSGSKNQANVSSGPSVRTVSQKANQTKTYTVRKGDSLQKIAMTTGVSVSELKSLNQLRNNNIRAGQKLVLKRNHVVTAAAAKPPQAARIGSLSTNEENMDVPIHGVLEREESVRTDGDSSHLFLGKWDDSKDKDLLVKISKGFLGAPYRFGGVSLKGIDCSAFVKRVYSVFDVTLPRTAREQAKVGQQVSKDELVVGDLVFFNTRRYYISHVGIYIGDGQFVHASSGRSKEVRISNINEPYYSKRFVQATRVKGPEDKL
ncbi:MAG: C40 family peptidase [Syntrophobacterales bacterium]|jgi:cell wall-associated NlpC family hydrolase|nr:C40 family peptidase [Syntrophobacterales bacterium]